MLSLLKTAVVSLALEAVIIYFVADIVFDADGGEIFFSYLAIQALKISLLALNLARIWLLHLLFCKNSSVDSLVTSFEANNMPYLDDHNYFDADQLFDELTIKLESSEYLNDGYSSARILLQQFIGSIESMKFTSPLSGPWIARSNFKAAYTIYMK